MDKQPRVIHYTQRRFKKSNNKRMSWLMALVVILIASGAIYYFSNRPASPENLDFESAQNVQQLTDNFFSQLEYYKQAKTDLEKEAFLIALEEIANSRKTEMQTLIKNNPRLFFNNAISEKQQSQIPKELANYFEKQISIRNGTLEVIYIHEEEKSYINYFIQKNQQRFNLYFIGVPPEASSGTIVNLKGYYLDDDLIVDLEETTKSSLLDIFIPIAYAQSANFEIVQEPKLETLGIQRIAVILVKDKNKDISDLPTKEEVYDKIFNGPVQEFFKENSYGKMSLKGDVYGWYEIDLDNADAVIFEDSVAAADKDINFSNNPYSDIIIGIGKPHRGIYGGEKTIMTDEGEITARRSVLKFTEKDEAIRGGNDLLTIVHELGHHLGLGHANLWICPHHAIRGDCKSIEYGNPFDIMGGGTGHFNAYFKDILNWSNVKDISNDGVFYVPVLESEDASISARVDSLNTKNARTYYLERRNARQEEILINWAYSKMSSRLVGIPDTYPPLLPVGKTFFDGTISITNQGGGKIYVKFAEKRPCEEEIKTSFDNSTLKINGKPGEKSPNGEIRLSAEQTLEITMTMSLNSLCSEVLPVQTEIIGPNNWKIPPSIKSNLRPEPNNAIKIPIPIMVPQQAEPKLYKITILSKPTDPVKAGVIRTSRASLRIRINYKENQPPIASFLSYSDSDKAPAEIVFLDMSQDPDKKPLSHQWDFGDGSPVSTKPNISHTFLNPGEYTVTLTVKDNEGLEDSHKETVIVKANQSPIAAFNFKPDFGYAPLTVQFTNQSSDPDNDTLNYHWNFGDGTTTKEINPSHTYTKSGFYSVSLVASDGQAGEGLEKIVEVLEPPVWPCTSCMHADLNNDGVSDVIDLNLCAREDDAKVRELCLACIENHIGCTYKIKTEGNQPPIASFLAPSQAYVNQSISLDASQSSDPDGDSLIYSWDLGDSATSNQAKLTHQYAQAGTYTVTINIDDQKGGLDTITKQIIISNANQPPQASFTAPSNVLTNKTVNFDASQSSDPDGDTLIYSWDFGDGSNTTGIKTTHQYSKAGNYSIKLTVDDNQEQDTINKQITITDSKAWPCSTCYDADLISDRLIDIQDSSQCGKEEFALQESCLQCTQQYFTQTCNQSPIAIISAPGQALTDRSITFDAGLSSDPDGDLLTYSWDLGDGTTSNQIKFTHSYQGVKNYTVKLTVADNYGGAGSVSKIVNITQANRSPVISPIAQQAVEEGQNLEFSVSASDPDGDPISITAQNLPNGASFIANKFQWPTNLGQYGNYQVTFNADDGQGGTDSKSVDIIVTLKPNELPIASFTHNVSGNHIYFDASASYDPDGAILDYQWQAPKKSFSGKQPGWDVAALFDGPGYHQIILSVTDDQGGIDSDTQTIHVPIAAVNTAPSITKFTSSFSDGDYVAIGSAINFMLDFHDDEGLAGWAVVLVSPEYPSGTILHETTWSNRPFDKTGIFGMPITGNIGDTLTFYFGVNDPEGLQDNTSISLTLVDQPTPAGTQILQKIGNFISDFYSGVIRMIKPKTE